MSSAASSKLSSRTGGASSRKAASLRRAAPAKGLTTPTYPRVAHSMTHHGDTREDPYHYFRDKKDPRIKKWLAAETLYAKEALTQLCDSTKDTIEQAMSSQSCSESEDSSFPPNLALDSFADMPNEMFKEMKSRWRETDMSLPSKDRNFWYFARTLEGQEHASYCRVPFVEGGITCRLLQDYAALLLDDPHAELPKVEGEEVMLDVNVLQEEFAKPYLEVGDFDVSHDERSLVVSLDLSDGQEIFTMFVLSLTHEAGDADSKPIPSKPAALLRDVAEQAKKSRKRAAERTSSSDAKGTSPKPASANPAHTHRILRQIDMFPASSEVMWMPDDSGFMYFAMDDTQRPHRVIYHDLTKPADSEDADIILFQEDDPQFSCSTLCYTDDEKFITFCVASKLQEECWVMPVGDALGLRAFLESSRWTFPCRDEPTSSETSPLRRSDNEDVDDSNVRLDPYTTTCPLFRVFKKRETCLEYDNTHVTFSAVSTTNDTAKLPGGAWLIANNRPGCRNFTIDFHIDDHQTAAEMCDDVRDELVPTMSWLPLLEYDDHCKIDHVSATAHFVIIGCRYRGCPTAYVIPMVTLEATIRGIAGGVMTPRSLQDRNFAVPSPELLLLAVGGCDATASPVSAEESRFQDALAHRTDDWRSVLSIELSANTDDYQCSQLRLYVHHPIFPARVYLIDYNVPPHTQSSLNNTDIQQQFKRPTLLRVEPTGKGKKNAYDPSDYTVRRVWVPASASCPIEGAVEGSASVVVEIPMTIVYRTSTFKAGTNACLITAYGSYGDCTDPEFSTERLSILDRGVVYAVAQIRGGGEMGRLWRDSGRMQHRITSIQDFIDCSSYLVQNRFSGAERLCALGGSAGGTVVAAAMLLAPPGLYKAVLPLVPFVDCLTTMLDPSIPLTTAEWEEWGNPLEDAAAYATIKAYSPMDVLDAAERRHSDTEDDERQLVLPRFVFVESGYGDPRVPHWEPMALVARLRDYASAAKLRSPDTPSTMVLHKCNLQAGHGGASGRYEQLHELADEYAFVVAAAYHQ